MRFNMVRSPSAWLKHTLGPTAYDSVLEDLETWWESEGRDISDAVDRARTPWLRMFDPTGKRLDQILYPPEYWKMLRKGYRSGVLWRAFKDHSLEPSWLLMYLTSFYDCGLTCPYTVSLSTALPLSKYGHDSLKERF